MRNCQSYITNGSPVQQAAFFYRGLHHECQGALVSTAMATLTLIQPPLKQGKRERRRGKEEEEGEEKGGGKSLLNQPAKLNRRSHRPLLS